MLNTQDFDRLLEFYTQLFGKQPDWQDGHYAGFKSNGNYFMIGYHDKVEGRTKNPERVLFNFSTQDLETEFNRLVKLGAKVVAKPYSFDEDAVDLIATLADPDGNYFQLMTPFKA